MNVQYHFCIEEELGGVCSRHGEEKNTYNNNNINNNNASADY
jgi:hypothetical protein